MKVKTPKSHKSPKYLPPARTSGDVLPPSCGAEAPFDVPWQCTREEGHEESSPEGQRDHAAHHDLASVASEDPDAYDPNLPTMVARWGSD